MKRNILYSICINICIITTTYLTLSSYNKDQMLLSSLYLLGLCTILVVDHIDLVFFLYNKCINKESNHFPLCDRCEYEEIDWLALSNPNCSLHNNTTKAIANNKCDNFIDDGAA